MKERFNDKVAFVTGATGALGRVVSEAFYNSGAKVAATYIVEKESESFPPNLKNDRARIMLIKADVTREEDVQSAFETALKAFGGIDFLVNIVGGYMSKTPITELQVKDWDRMMDMNLKSAFLCSKYGLRIMQKKSGGRIISISAMAGLEPSAGRGAYGVSKAAITVLTKIIGEEVKGTGITANAIAPSMLVTEANVKSSPDEDHSKWVHPREIADLILFLCSDSAKSINGEVFKVYGGI